MTLSYCFNSRHFPPSGKAAACCIILLLLLLVPMTSASKATGDNPVEIGHVNWGRDFAQAQRLSREHSKPILILFQEVPGCIGCQDFGRQVLTHPLLVEAIEEEFIPVVVFNNRSSGQDAEMLRRYNEPSWNYQVIRFVDATGADIIPRRDRIWTIAGVASRMAAALEAAGKQVPLYLRAVALENDRQHLGLTAFAMSCFWTGEYIIGQFDGVVSTEAGWYDGREVTLIRYHKKVTDLDTLVKQAEQQRCAQAVYTNPSETVSTSRVTVKPLHLMQYRSASKRDQKKQVQQWLEKQEHLRLTPMQEMKLNSLMVTDKHQAFSWLSPRQLGQLD